MAKALLHLRQVVVCGERCSRILTRNMTKKTLPEPLQDQGGAGWTSEVPFRANMRAQRVKLSVTPQEVLKNPCFTLTLSK